jgi:hypothetical protein
MQPADSCDLFSILDQITDHRGRQGQRHTFNAMLAAIICGTLSGIRSMRMIAKWVRQLEPSTYHWLGFKRIPPCANTYTDLLKEICPEEFEQAIREWTRTLEGVEIDNDSLRATSIDGKTLCGSLQTHQRAVHLLAALDHQTGCVLSQTRVDCKTNEAKAVFDLFKTLVMKGKVIIGDAMFCQRDICEEIVDSDGDYFFTVKENQPTLLKEIRLAFAETEGFSPLATTRNGSGTRRSFDAW